MNFRKSPILTPPSLPSACSHLKLILESHLFPLSGEAELALAPAGTALRDSRGTRDRGEADDASRKAAVADPAGVATFTARRPRDTAGARRGRAGGRGVAPPVLSSCAPGVVTADQSSECHLSVGLKSVGFPWCLECRRDRRQRGPLSGVGCSRKCFRPARDAVTHRRGRLPSAPRLWPTPGWTSVPESQCRAGSALRSQSGELNSHPGHAWK